MSRFFKKGKRKQERGITLIALITTIIVLLILAGITIGAITGSNGIIGQAQSAKEETEISQEKEIIDISTVEAMGKNNRGNLEEEEFQTAVSNHTNGKAEVTDTGEEFEVFFEESNRYYTVDKDGNILDYTDIVIDNSPGDLTKDENGDTIEEGKPLEIWCIEDLVEWSKNYSKYLNKEIALCRNLNFKSKYSYSDSENTNYGDVNNDGKTESLINEMQTGEGFNPIYEFRGEFYGENNLIDNFYVNKSGNAGLFIYANGNIHDITIKGNITSQTSDAGVFVYGGNSTIENVNNYATINGSSAGMIALCQGEMNIINCNNFGDIEGKSAVGGICGDKFFGQVLNCKNEGTIKSSHSANYGVGGICGNTSDTSNIESFFNNCINTGEIIYDGTKGNWYFGGTGGLIGLIRNPVTAKNCVNLGKVTSTSYQGAICGMELHYSVTNEKYEVINSFMLDNVELTTGSIPTDESATKFQISEIPDVIEKLNSYIAENNLDKQGWKRWEQGENGYPELKEVE